MLFVIDMNLSPKWCDLLTAEGWQAVHWADIGDATATDSAIMEWAISQQAIVITLDLDFGAILAATKALGPSVVLIRTQDALPESIGTRLVQALHDVEQELLSGALVVFDEARSRVRLLPINRPASN